MLKVKDGHENDYVHVNGDTRYLKDCRQEDLAVLAKNGDSRVMEDSSEKNAEQALVPVENDHSSVEQPVGSGKSKKS